MSRPEPLEAAANRYFALRRKLGYALRTEREEVLLFAREMDALRRRKITLDLVIAWARSARHGSPKYAAWRYECVRRFLTVAAGRSSASCTPQGCASARRWRSIDRT